MFQFGLEALIDAPVELPTDPLLWQKNTPYLYKKRTLVIEYLPGDIRRKIAADGTPYENLMVGAYGYIQDTTDRMGDRIDFFLNPVFDPTAPIFIIDQIVPVVNTFDEHKVFFGFPDQNALVALYDAVFSDGSGMHRIGAIVETHDEAFEDWIATPEMLLSPASRQSAFGFKITPIIPMRLPAMANPPTSKPKSVVEHGAVTLKLPVPSRAPQVVVKSNGEKGYRYECYCYAPVIGAVWRDALVTLLRYLENATSDDQFIFHISSPGGCVFTAGRLVSAMRATQASVTTIAEGPVASAGVTLWSHGKTRVITPAAYFMQHMTFQTASGSTDAMAQQLQFTSAYVREQSRRYVEIGLFTQDELEDMIQREGNIFITADEAIARVGVTSHD